MRFGVGHQLTNHRDGRFPFPMDHSLYAAIGVLATLGLEPMLVATIDAISVT
jgi:hypothetical protein